MNKVKCLKHNYTSLGFYCLICVAEYERDIIIKIGKELTGIGGHKKTIYNSVMRKMTDRLRYLNRVLN